MKKYLQYPITSVLITLFCSNLFAAPLTFSKDIKDFNQIELATKADLILQQGSSDTVKIVVDKSDLSNVIVKKSGETLYLGYDNSFWSSVPEITFYITMKKIHAITDSSSGNIQIKTAINTDNLALSSHSSGSIQSSSTITVANKTIIASTSSGNITLGTLNSNNIDINVLSSGSIGINQLNSNAIIAFINSSGKATIGSGNVKNQTVSVASSGIYNAQGMHSENGDFNISSAGNIYAYASQSVTADISSGGNLYLSGQPKIKSLSVNSGGRIHNS